MREEKSYATGKDKFLYLVLREKERGGGGVGKEKQKEWESDREMNHFPLFNQKEREERKEMW